MKSRLRVKVCGITRAEDAWVAAQSGADSIGLVFYEPSPRNVSIAQAREIIDGLPAFVTVTALFVNPLPVEVHNVLRELEIDLLQFHGDETPDFCVQFARPYIKAIAMKQDTDLASVAVEYAKARAILVDTYKPGVPGGTGETFNWQLLPNQLNKSLILAGGLTPENVQNVPGLPYLWAVDVSGGVELAKGIKCDSKIERFIQAVNQIDKETL